MKTALAAITIMFALCILPLELILGLSFFPGLFLLVIFLNLGTLNPKKQLRFDPPEPPGPKRWPRTKKEA